VLENVINGKKEKERRWTRVGEGKPLAG